MAGNSPASSRPVTLRLSLGCELREVRGAVRTVRGFVAEQGWDADDLTSFELALVEACNNAVKYAGEAGRRQPILLEAISEANGIEFRVHDHTPGFDWPVKIQLPEPESESGRGLYLIHSLMDRAGYFRGQNENMLVMSKRRPAGLSPGYAESLEAQARKLAENDVVIHELLEELSSCYESLSAIFRYSTEQGKPGSLKEFAERLFRDLLQIMAAEWFVLRLVPRDEGLLAVFAASEPALGLEPLTIPDPGGQAQSVEIEAALKRQPVWFDSHGPKSTEEALMRAKPGSAGLVLPILAGEQLIGTVALGKQDARKSGLVQRESVFTAAQASVASTFADFLAIQIVNSRFQEERFRQRLVTHELEIANNIQRSLLLTTLPQVPGFSLAAFCRSAHEVGGDFYDVLKINDHSVLLVIADVMGKGIPAAMFAAMLRTLLRAAPELTHQPSALLTRVNRLLFPELSAVDMFITAQLAFIDSRARKIILANAGHSPLAVAHGDAVRMYSPEGMPLGIECDSVFRDAVLDLPENCRVLLYTDGLTEALNAKREHFGQARLMDWLTRGASKAHTAEQLKMQLIEELEAHQASTALNDDQTFLILCG
ncbi:MAG: Protein serine/threonine phosphatase [Pedosphaera sp.]|nr:Protein serine/threonine phosphatase [Pedosphaera sp.]